MSCRACERMRQAMPAWLQRMLRGKPKPPDLKAQHEEAIRDALRKRWPRGPGA